MNIRIGLLTVGSALLLALAPALAGANDGMINVKSVHDVAATESRLVQALEGKGMTVFARIDHAEGAASVDKALRPTRLVVFGNPKAGTPLMQCRQSAAIDLPQKALIWEDSEGTVWLGYNDPEYLKQRHDIEGCDQVIKKIEGALAGFAKAATE